MKTKLHSTATILHPADNHRLRLLCGQLDENIRFIEKQLSIQVNNRGNEFYLTGHREAVELADTLLQDLYDHLEHNHTLSIEDVQIHLQKIQNLDNVDIRQHCIRTKQSYVQPRSKNQSRYIKRIRNFDINFGIGPAGTGKTYLAMACAVEAFEQDLVNRIVLVRPAVEAGEKLGFLPGDLAEKIDPYLRPLFDALYDLMHIEKVEKLIEKNIIEVAPLAYMRGRTLNDAFIIMDESQNTTKEQMKMFLTRIGFGSKAVITGDVTQTDLPKSITSGLSHAIRLFSEIELIKFTFFESFDVVRHPLVQLIIEAYDSADSDL
ncbi:MAG: hypothetical protein A3F17_01670 [Gammaproteobacteria bacterium RIFCSPHIGHO2_12_FULL_41_15]|nr:MAG: hypothetical protein A3F17_01670 [Gammaproteobacteria bacterium RIFCSPHIGHO2_12_FULL_41_15]